MIYDYTLKTGKGMIFFFEEFLRSIVNLNSPL